MYPGGSPSVNKATVSKPPVTQPAKYHQGAVSNLQVASLIYLGLILLGFELIVNLIAQVIVRRVARKQGLAAATI